MTPITPAQLKRINTIISKRGIDKDTKAMMVEGFTAGRSTSSKDLYFAEADAFLKHLQHNDPNRDAAEKMRRKMLYYAHEMGWHTYKNGKFVADVQRVDKWCLQFGYVKRKLDNYSYEELPKLVSQFAAVYRDYLNKI